METFVPLYISNYCDSTCLMCNLRKNNEKVIRMEASIDEIRQQLLIIRDYEKITAVCFLTGERYFSKDRLHNLTLVIDSIKMAFELNFERVFFNIGSLSYDEIQIINQSFNFLEKRKIVLSLFQETYNKEIYAKYFGTGEFNVKSDYEMRLSTMDIWVESGFSSIDIGILLGFERDIEADVNSLINHANKFASNNIEVYVSIPRIKNGSFSDAEYIKIIKKLHDDLPSAKIILTTRERIDFINSVIDYINVVSPGSSDICPYSHNEYISNREATSQFVIEEKRMRPSAVLNQLKCDKILYYNSNCLRVSHVVY